MNSIFLCIVFLSQYTLLKANGEIKEKDIWLHVVCDEEYYPENCDFNRIPDVTVEDYERCAPAELPLYVRNYFLGWSGRGLTYKQNQVDFKKIRIIPNMLRDVTDRSLEITALNQKVSFPVGIAPAAFQKLANPDGEVATALAAAKTGTIMILSSYSSTSIEDVAAADPSANLWMQVYVFKKRQYTIDLVRRAERSGYKAIVLTCDSPFAGYGVCSAKRNPNMAVLKLGNIPEKVTELEIDIATFDDISWLRSITSLPIVAKGILKGEDAVKAVDAGASAIIVSNHGGRQLDSDISSIDALPGVVKAINYNFPPNLIDIYLDGGVRNGFDVYKALARGAKMVFIGRPTLWGLTLEGTDGVENVLNILKREFNNSMILAGFKNPSEIRSDTVIPNH